MNNYSKVTIWGAETEVGKGNLVMYMTKSKEIENKQEGFSKPEINLSLCKVFD